MPFDTSMYQNYQGGTGLAALGQGIRQGLDIVNQRKQQEQQAKQLAMQEEAAKRQQASFESEQGELNRKRSGELYKTLGETSGGLLSIQDPQAQQAEYMKVRDNLISQGMAKPQDLPESFQAARPMAEFYSKKYQQAQQATALDRQHKEAEIRKLNAEAGRARTMSGAPPKGFSYAMNPQTGEMELAPSISPTEAKQLGLHEMGTRAEQQYQAAVKNKDEYNPTNPGQWIDNSEWAPAWLKNDKANEAHAAQSAWVEAYLRDASGAAIPPSERMAYAKDFFARPGDSDQVIANKEVLRSQKMQNALVGAGPAAMYASKPLQKTGSQKPGASGSWGGIDSANAGTSNQTPQTVIQNGHTYTLNPKTGKYE